MSPDAAKETSRFVRNNIQAICQLDILTLKEQWLFFLSGLGEQGGLMSVCRDGLSHRSQKGLSSMVTFKGDHPIVNGAQEHRHPLDPHLFPSAHSEALVE